MRNPSLWVWAAAFSLLALPLRARTYEEWSGVYLQGHKIGYAYLKVTPTAKGYRVLERTYMNLRMLGQEKTLTTFLEAETDGQFRTRSFRFEFVTGDQQARVEGRREGQTLEVTFRTGTSGRRSFSTRDRFYLPAVLNAALVYGRASPGPIQLFDPALIALMDGTLRDLGTRTVSFEGQQVQAQAYEIRVPSGTSIAYLWQGRLIRSEAELGLVSVAEPQELAVQVGGEKVDLLLLYAVKPDRVLPPLDRVRRLRLRLENLPSEGLVLAFANQRLIRKGKDWAEVEITRPVLRPGNPDGFSPDLEPYLEPTPLLQVDEPRIQSLAQEITAGLTDPVEKARRLLDWVYQTLEKRPSVTIPTALDVLDTGYGDCNEHSVLFAALARAAGIPTEIVVGLVYQGDAFFYHAWNAIYTGREWVFVDPVFGEFPASAGHLMLQRGSLEKQAELMPVVGKLQIRVLSVD